MKINDVVLICAWWIVFCAIDFLAYTKAMRLFVETGCDWNEWTKSKFFRFLPGGGIYQYFKWRNRK